MACSWNCAKLSFEPFWEKTTILGAFSFWHFFAASHARTDGIYGWATRFSAATETACAAHYAEKAKQEKRQIGRQSKSFSKFR
jgi:hypothetical protein